MPKSLMTCRICGNDSQNVEYEVREMMLGLRDPFIYFKCSACGCLQIREYPQDIGKYYSGAYYSFWKGKDTIRRRVTGYLWKCRNFFEITGKGLLGKLISRFYPNEYVRHVFRYVDYYSAIKPGYKVLDVGCGSGGFLKSLRDLGFKDLTGVDPYIDNDIHLPPGLRIVKKELAEIEGSYDLIFLSHSLEHMPHQHLIVEKIRAILKPEGLCIVGVPLVSSDAWDRYGINWFQIDAPRHFYVHTELSLARLFQTHGLKVVGTVFNSTSAQFILSEQYAQGIPMRDDRSFLRNKKLLSRAQLRAFDEEARRANIRGKGDQAIFVFRQGGV